MTRATERIGQPAVATTPIEVERLAVSYLGRPAVVDVSARFPAGEISAVIGPSGCGKSSFLTSLNRLSELVPGCAVTGTVRLDGVDVQSIEPVALRRRVGMIFQSPNPFPLSIRDNIQLALREHGLRDRGRLEEVTRRVLTDVGLLDEIGDRLDTPGTRLSGGQQQRLCIARALALEPEVLLLDEPCSALDPIAASTVEDLIRNLRGRYTVVVVTHNLAQARRLADTVAVFWVRDGAGRLIEHGPAEAVFDRPRDPLTAAYVAGRTG